MDLGNKSATMLIVLAAALLGGVLLFGGCDAPQMSAESTACCCCPCCRCCEPPQPPTQPPDVQPGDLVGISFEAARSLRDASTAAKLGQAISKACDAAEVSDSLVEAVRIIQDAIRRTLSERQGDSAEVDWLGGWRVPVSDAVALRRPVTIEQYVRLMRDAATGLLEASK